MPESFLSFPRVSGARGIPERRRGTPRGSHAGVTVVFLVIVLFARSSFAQSSYGAGNGISNLTINGSGCTTSGSAILKGNGAGGCSNATSGTDFVPPTSGTAIQKANGSGGLVAAVQNSDYFGGEITLCNGVSGTSGGSFTCYQVQNGHYKKTTCYLNAYYNSTGTAQTCSLTANGGTAFSSSGYLSSNVAPFGASLTGSPPNSISLPTNMLAAGPETGTVIAEGN
jgi:hypothetical protein